MLTATDPVELLERAIGYTRGTLGTVTDDLMSRRTPCADWDLAALLAHMSDGLDAFTEASRGHIDIAPAPPADTTVGELREKACTLLGAWTSPAVISARLGALVLDSGLLLRVGALEIAVHGWDVGQATGVGTPIPAGLARNLLPVARQVVTDDDRPGRFGAPITITEDVEPALRLLSRLGRAGAWAHQR
ncbi:uncharacterized protein (TIGR03086 family) [Nocardioides daedukensis]|uniref:Uncharacterized protein (TIGR03086 family) n=1 Tax=Nocardioides daedukensis TaxID=634462 RepID=A0A7Y9S315_9ACTN|nr:uncharacterized protein (TIGR03086 family) [Nocardioides daedukensis]